MGTLRLLTFFACLCLGTASAAATEVVAKGLVRDRAMLVIDGQTRFLKVGESSPEGVKLVSSNSREAVVDIHGERHDIRLSQTIASSFSESQGEEVRVRRGEDSHYRVSGAINGKPVEMMVDTGATAVVLSSEEARRLGINFENGRKAMSSTASGRAKTWLVNLRSVRVGTIELNGVQGAVIVGSFPEQILLGNSFLSRVSVTEEGGVMVMRSRF